MGCGATKVGLIDRPPQVKLAFTETSIKKEIKEITVAPLPNATVNIENTKPNVASHDVLKKESTQLASSTVPLRSSLTMVISNFA